MTSQLKRRVLLLAIVAIGLGFTAVFLSNLTTTDEQHVFGVVSGYSLLFAVILTGSSEWFRRQEFTGDELVYILTWVGAGTVPLGLVTWLVLAEHATLRSWTIAFDVAHIMVLGAVGGELTGTILVQQRQTTSQLQATTTRLEALVAASPLAIITVDEDGKITSWNAAAERIFGWSEAEALGADLPDMETAASFDDLLARARTGQTVEGIEEERGTKSGDRIDVRTHFSPIYEDGDIVGGMAIVRDITAENERQEELRRNQELLHWTERMADVGGWEVDLKEDTVEWTDGTRRIHEVGDEYEPDLDSAIEFYHPDHRE